MTEGVTTGAVATQTADVGRPSNNQTTNLGDILERVLDKGLVIAGDIQVNLLDIELLTIKLRLVIVSVETAKQMGIDWWEHDPWLHAHQPELEQENERLRQRISVLENGHDRRPIEASSQPLDE
jgi:hypothetical protein